MFCRERDLTVAHLPIFFFLPTNKQLRSSSFYGTVFCAAVCIYIHIYTCTYIWPYRHTYIFFCCCFNWRKVNINGTQMTPVLFWWWSRKPQKGKNELLCFFFPAADKINTSDYLQKSLYQWMLWMYQWILEQH